MPGGEVRSEKIVDTVSGRARIGPDFLGFGSKAIADVLQNIQEGPHTTSGEKAEGFPGKC